jgi:hypothetical protein
MSEGDFDLELGGGTSAEPKRGVTERQLLTAWKTEINQYHRSLVEFSEVEPDEIFIQLAGISARASEIRKDLVRMGRRDSNSLRTQEIDPLITECDRQFKYWSRVVTVRGIDAQLAGGV